MPPIFTDRSYRCKAIAGAHHWPSTPWCRIVFAMTAAWSLMPVMGCCATSGADGRSLLSPPSTADLAKPGLPPVLPFAQTLGAGSFSRSVFQEPNGPAGTKIELIDAVIASRKSANFPAAAGPVLIDLRSGSGNVSASAKISILSFTTPVSVAAGNAVLITNTGLQPLVVRLYIVEGQ